MLKTELRKARAEQRRALRTAGKNADIIRALMRKTGSLERKITKARIRLCKDHTNSGHSFSLFRKVRRNSARKPSGNPQGAQVNYVFHGRKKIADLVVSREKFHVPEEFLARKRCRRADSKTGRGIMTANGRGQVLFRVREERASKGSPARPLEFFDGIPVRDYSVTSALQKTPQGVAFPPRPLQEKIRQSERMLEWPKKRIKQTPYGRSSMRSLRLRRRSMPNIRRRAEGSCQATSEVSSSSSDSKTTRTIPAGS